MQNSLKPIINYSKTVAEQPVNVSDAVSDVKTHISSGGVTLDFYSAEILSSQDYYPFGMLMPERGFSSHSYRFGHNGQEPVNEQTGINGSHYTALFWEYDARLGRRWNMDPVDKPWMSSYHAFSNKPIINIDPNGALDGWIEDDAGSVSWDPNTNSQEELDANYSGMQGYSYVSDANDPRTYTFSDGSGKLTMLDFVSRAYEKDNYNYLPAAEFGSLQIDLLYSHSNENAKCGWMQTYSSNTPDVDVNSVNWTLPLEQAEERTDGGGIYNVMNKADVTQATYYGSPTNRLEEYVV